MKMTHIAGIALFVSAGVAMAGDMAGDEVAQAGMTGSKSTTNPAAPGSEQSNREFEVLDKNGDGYLTKSEALDQITDYDDADRNSDGRLDRGEFSAFEVKDADAPHSDTHRATDDIKPMDTEADTNKDA